MFENLYTTKMSADKKQLQNRFAKIRFKNGRISKMMSLIMALFLAITFLSATVVLAALNNETEKEPITLYLKGEVVVLENKPFIQDNMTYFPLRETFEKLGVFDIDGNELVWDNGTIYIKVAESSEKECVSYTIKIGSDNMVVAHSKDLRIAGVTDSPNMKINFTMPGEAPLLISGKTYVPYTFIDYMLNRGLGLRNQASVFDFMFTINEETPKAFLSQGFMLPCDGKVSNPFGERMHPITKEIKKHNGVDIAATEGADVNSAIAGTVTKIGFDNEKGNYVVIERDNIKTVYAHLMQATNIAEGDEVLRGQTIGKAGKTGTAAGVYLHFEVLINGEYFDPELIL